VSALDPPEIEIPKERRDALIRLVEQHGARVVEDWNEPEGARFIGVFAGDLITLFPKYDRHFAMYFTVAHLYGHLCQQVRPSPEVRVLDLSAPERRIFSRAEIQCIYDYEIEAAAIGRRAIAELGPIEPELDRQYSRMFFADFHYLINTLETGEHGMECFERFLRREPVPFRLIEPDPRPLIDVSSLATAGTSDVTVL
jgi:hypothetical protein